MPMGPSVGGFLYFAGVKFAGYSAFAHVLRKKFDDAPAAGITRTLQIGGLRTLIGVGVGVCYGLLMGMAVDKINIVWLRWIVFFAALIPVRLAEWYWLLRIAFKQKVRGHPQIESSILLGTFVSYVLDAIGVAAAFVLPGGMWVC